MRTFSNILQVYRYLDAMPSFQKHGSKAARPGLERIQLFCNEMQNPEKHLHCIHIAGTNGKGSVGAMLALVYENAGYRCGLYTSPHLDTIRERFRINRVMIPEKEMLHFFQLYGEQLSSMKLSYFEITTALAFWWFSKEKTDIVILETGMGGRLDATNVVDPVISVITSISHDHQNFLGRTYREIAEEKAGIIKYGRPVVIGNMPEIARKTISAIAAQRNSELWDARKLQPRIIHNKTGEKRGSPADWDNTAGNGGGGGTDTGIVTKPGGNRIQLREMNRIVTIETDLEAPVHRWNVAVSWYVTRCLMHKFPVSEPIFIKSINTVNQSGILPGRFEKLSSGLKWYFDGAHNPEAVKQLISAIKTQEWDQEPVMVLCLMKDKAQKKMLYPFSVFKKNYYYVLNTERAADVTLITPYLSNLKCLPPKEDEIIDFFAGLTKDVVIFTGSFYFYCVVKRWVSRIIKAE